MTFKSHIKTYEECQVDPAYNLIPQTTINDIIAFIDEGKPVGVFLECVLSNDLVGSFACADEHNIRAMNQIVSFLYNCIPPRQYGIWGTRNDVLAWTGKGGLKSREEQWEYELTGKISDT